MSTTVSTATNTLPDWKQVQQQLLKIGDEFRARHSWLFRQQDNIGLAIFLISSFGIIINAILYYLNLLPIWATVIIAAIWMSFLHELEHDLIHSMYFRKNKTIYNLMMAGVWLFRPSTISPWVRKKLHLHHHKTSGTASDMEERGITNGEKWGVKRLLMMGDHMLAIYLRVNDSRRMMRDYVRSQNPASKKEAVKIVVENILGYFPLGTLHYLLWHGFIIGHLVAFIAPVIGQPITVSANWMQFFHIVDFLVVVLLLPNVLRVFCLHFVSSNMHYYGDVVPGDVIQQTQVWNAWWLLPFHLFCFNFGATHAIHHFVVRDPFYIRQLTAYKMYPVMRQFGVRFNDFGTFKRANRWKMVADESSVVAGSMAQV